MRLPVKSIIQAKVLVTEQQGGSPTGSGDQHDGQKLSLGETIGSLARERRLVFDETLTLLDSQVSWDAGKSTTERLTFRETTLTYLNSQIISTQRLAQPPASTLTANFGRGGFGQLGFGGTIDVTG